MEQTTTTPTKKIKILVSDFDPVILDGTKYLLRQSGLFELVGETGDETEGLRLIEQLNPDLDLVLFRISSFKRYGDGEAFAKNILLKYPQLKRVALTSSDSTLLMLSFLHFRVSGYLHLSDGEAALRTALLAVMQGELKISDKIYTRTSEVAETIYKEIEEKIKTLTATERGIVEAILVYGGSNDRLAEIAGISPEKVNTHLEVIFNKLGLQKRTDLFRYGNELMLALSTYPNEVLAA